MSLKLEVGEFYLSASGEIININGKDGDMFLDTNSNGYFLNGNVRPKDKTSVYDLIAHIPKELHYDIIKTIISYHTDGNSIKKCIDYAYNNKGIQCK